MKFNDFLREHDKTGLDILTAASIAKDITDEPMVALLAKQLLFQVEQFKHELELVGFEW